MSDVASLSEVASFISDVEVALFISNVAFSDVAFSDVASVARGVGVHLGRACVFLELPLLRFYRLCVLLGTLYAIGWHICHNTQSKTSQGR